MEKTQSDAASVCASLQARLMTFSNQEIIGVVKALVEDPNTGENILYVVYVQVQDQVYVHQHVQVYEHVHVHVHVGVDVHVHVYVHVYLHV